MSDIRYSGEMEVRYFHGAKQIAVGFRPDAPLSGDLVTLEGREYLIERRAVRISEVTDQFEAFEVQVKPLGSEQQTSEQSEEEGPSPTGS